MYDHSAGVTVVLIEQERPVKARKMHGCDQCTHPIEPGFVYLRTACTIDGEFRVSRIHAPDCYLYE